VPRKARTIPFGYKVHHENKDYLVPVPVELEALKKAKQFIDEKYTWRSVREWIIKATGRNISLAGLSKILKKRKSI
jgi:hypothetical protein